MNSGDSAATNQQGSKHIHDNKYSINLTTIQKHNLNKMIYHSVATKN